MFIEASVPAVLIMRAADGDPEPQDELFWNERGAQALLRKHSHRSGEVQSHLAKVHVALHPHQLRPKTTIPLAQ